jgi:hypothetical protein
MRTRRAATISDLRRAIDLLPRATRVAMLEGIGRNDIIVGAYTAPEGICPMLAAHRAGQRTSFISFAKAWDTFALGGARDRTARRATRRELLVLTAHLQTSLLEERAPAPDLADAIDEHRGVIGRRARAGDPDRSRELRSRPGWAWARVVRRHDDHERAPARLARERAGVSRSRGEKPLATSDFG